MLGRDSEDKADANSFKTILKGKRGTTERSMPSSLQCSLISDSALWVSADRSSCGRLDMMEARNIWQRNCPTVVLPWPGPPTNTNLPLIGVESLGLGLCPMVPLASDFGSRRSEETASMALMKPLSEESCVWPPKSKPASSSTSKVVHALGLINNWEVDKDLGKGYTLINIVACLFQINEFVAE